jgi:hypothetical protein
MRDMRKAICAALAILSVILAPVGALASEAAFVDPRDAIWELVLSLQITNKPKAADKAYALFFNFLYSNDFTQQELDSMASLARSSINAWNSRQSGTLGESGDERLNWLIVQATTAAQSMGATLSFDASSGKATIERGSRTYAVPINETESAQRSVLQSADIHLSTDDAAKEVEASVGDVGKVIKATGLALDFRPLSILAGTLVSLLAIVSFRTIFTESRLESK